MFVVAAILMIWIVSFLVLLLPSRWIGRSTAQTGANLFYGTLISVALTKLFIACIAIVLVFCQFSFLPRFNADPERFGLFLLAVLFALPVFSALMLGFLRARKPPSGIGKPPERQAAA